MIAAFVIAVVGWFGLRPRHVKEFAVHLTKERRAVSISLVSLAVAVTGSAIYTFIHVFQRDDGLEEVSLGLILLFFVFVIWHSLVESYLDQRRTLRTGLWVFGALCVAGAIVLWGITSDYPIWLRVVLPTGSFATGFATAYIRAILENRRRKKPPAKATDKLQSRLP